jgi:hypothetical protein
MKDTFREYQVLYDIQGQRGLSGSLICAGTQYV